MSNELSNTRIVRHPQRHLEVVEVVDKKTYFVYFRAITKPQELTDFQIYKLYQQSDHLEN
jgi:hypothetical protein